jgi:methionyl-tRNA formyltransferase
LNDEKNTGVSIMFVDEELDHGPIVAQKAVPLSAWPMRASQLEETLMREGGALLARLLPHWIAGEIDARPQNHDLATYSEKIKKEAGLLDLGGNGYANLLKIRAFEGWPGTYAFFERAGKKIRVGILDAHLQNEKLVIDIVKPEGKREMSYEEFLRSGARAL